MVIPFPARNRHAIYIAAKIIGTDPGTIRQWLHKGLLGDKVQGQKMGRERLLDVAEGTVLRLLLEFLPLSSSLKDAWSRAIGLAQGLVPYAESYREKTPPFPLDLFAFEAWGTDGAGERNVSFICADQLDLSDCVSEHAAAGWPHIHVFNVGETVNEVLLGWDLATLGAEEGRHRFQDVYLPSLPMERRARALATFADLEQRLAGARPASAAPARTWPAWDAPANVA